VVDAGRRADKPVLRLRDHERATLADDPLGLAEDHLDLARVALARGDANGRLGSLDPVEVDDATLCLRDALLREHQHVFVLERGKLDDEGSEIVALADLRQAVHGDDRDHSSPVMRTPA